LQQSELRQPLDEYLAQLPLERVWKIHLAGGTEMDGFWLGRPGNYEIEITPDDAASGVRSRFRCR
jgi:uncharacterized protein (UPF0276 family)